MELFVVVSDALQNLQCVLDIRLIYGDRLEAALQRGILFDVLAVLVEGGGADDLNFAAAQRGLEDVGGVHAALGIAGAHDVVDLVDNEDDVARLADLLDQPLHAAFKLTAELGACHQCRKVQQIDLLLAQLERHIAGDDALGQSLSDGGLAHAGLTDEAGVVLLSAVQNLNDPLDLLFAANDGVQLAVTGTLAQVDAVIVQKLALLVLFAAGRLLLTGPGVVAGLLGRRVAAVAEQAIQERKRGGLAALLIVLTAVLRQVVHLLRAAECLHHLTVDVFQVLRRDAHALHHLLHLGQAQLGGTFQAQALIDHLVLLVHAGDEHDGHVFLASGTKCRLHGIPPLSVGVI